MYDVDALRAGISDTLRAFQAAAPAAAKSFLKDRPDLAKYVRDVRGKLVGHYYVRTSPQVMTRVDVFDNHGYWAGYAGDLFVGELDRDAVLTTDTFSPCS